MSSGTSGATFSEMIVEALERHGSREAFVLGDRRMSYAEAAALTSQIVQVFGAKGVTHGSTVGALSPNAPEAWLVQAAAYLLGARYTGLPPLASTEDHVFLCDDSEMDLLVVHPVFADAGGSIAERAQTVKHVLTFGPAELGEDLLALCADRTPRRLEPVPVDEEDAAWLQYTGGTTGRPKGVVLPHRAMVAQAQAWVSSYGLPEEPRYLAAAPITHAAVLPVLPTLMRGGTVVLQSSFSPQAWLQAVQDERINFAFGVPTMLYAILDHGEPSKYDLSSLQAVVYGAAPMSPTRIAEAIEVLGPVLVQGYGQTESAGFGTVLRKDEHDSVNRPELLTSCGRAAFGVRAEVLDEDGAVVPTGEVGEICFRSRGVMNGYLKQPELTAEVLRGGWLRTGDMARRDEAGYFHIVDRKKDMVISGGFNIYPREVEDVIIAHPSVASAAVIGVPDDKWGEAVKAFVVPRPGAEINVDELVETVRERKGPHHAPKSVEVVAELPTTPAGKLDKKVLRAKYWSGQERQVH